jgi:hypothetical protein
LIRTCSPKWRVQAGSPSDIEPVHTVESLRDPWQARLGGFAWPTAPRISNPPTAELV